MAKLRVELPLEQSIEITNINDEMLIVSSGNNDGFFVSQHPGDSQEPFMGPVYQFSGGIARICDVPITESQPKTRGQLDRAIQERIEAFKTAKSLIGEAAPFGELMVLADWVLGKEIDD